MNDLIEFIRKYYYWFLFVTLEVFCLVLLFRFNNYQGSVWFTSANTLTAKVDRIYGDMLSYLKLGIVNRDLTARNIMLQRQVNELRDLLQTFETDSTLKEKQEKHLKGYRIIPATVTSNSIRKPDNYIIIDKGEIDGIHSEMGVVGGGGIVGIVFMTGPHYSIVQPVLNIRSNISCRIRGHRFFGYLEWDGKNPLIAYLTDIPRYAHFKVGDYVETSGYSSIFPPGLFVGRILQINNSNDGLSYRVKVNLGTDFANLRDVMVIENKDRSQLDSLKVHAVESETQEN